jgi:glycosyltransferase involved in cell wall biosynthesis
VECDQRDLIHVMNILYLASIRIPNEKASGLAIVRQCEAFAKAGNSVTMARPVRKNRIQENIFEYYLIDQCFDVVEISAIDTIGRWGMLGFILTRGSQMCAFLWYLLFNHHRFDVIYARDEWMLFLPLLLRTHKKIVWEPHTKHDNFVIRYVAKRAHLVVPISGGLRDFFFVSNQRTHVLVEPSGVDIKQFENLPTQGEVRTHLNLPQDKIIVGYVGKYTTMGEGKGIDELVHAFSELKGLDAHLLIVGLESNEIKKVLALCKSTGLSDDSYSLLPLIQKDFALYLHASDILVMNYPDTEHYRLYMSPTKLFAYMAAGKIIISSDLPSIREIVDERMVVFVRPGDRNDLRDKLSESGAHLYEFQEMKEVSRNEVSKYSWNNRTARIVENLNKL